MNGGGPQRGSRALRALTLALLAILLSGCQVAKSGFQDEADTIGANFAAAATTLTYLHEGKLTRQYARAAFVDYATVTTGADSSLRKATGAPSGPGLDRLLRLYAPAARAIDDPCLDTVCDWRGQVDALQQASAAFRRAATA